MNPEFPLTVISPEARIGEGVKVGPFSVIDADVEIGEGTWIGPHVTIMPGTRIGRGCRIFPGAVIGAIPQDLKYNGEYATVQIGDNVTIREYCTVNKGTKAAETTKIGDRCLLMAYVHIAHDCTIGNNVILANNVNLAGHIQIEDYAILGGLTAVHQFVRIGAHVMIGGGSLVSKDVPPFVKAARDPLSYTGVNSIGLRRRGFSHDQIHIIQDIYRVMFVKGLNISQALAQITTQLAETPERATILEFVNASERGIMRGFNHLKSGRNNGHSN